eukprot:CAMPEP_0202970346 /NCGR_PEP_ID=MMETSP1396-20130829/16306_1 /ASSEMBLY_ACC=CAM_ASM_000872 /TAXON_ID= /ORGANISM="Pseudokeronopsis sp., Strain Brazil" /LENGTH=76 /DNA_ID=CAMNT_0049698775 /DNA_START=95 /DNA_END=322 /DNA_ORIENTATION=-
MELEGGQKLKVGSLQGRKIVGKEVPLPPGYKGYLFGRQEVPLFDDEGQRKLNMIALGQFDKVMEWKKDNWREDKQF